MPEVGQRKSPVARFRVAKPGHGYGTGRQMSDCCRIESPFALSLSKGEQQPVSHRCGIRSCFDEFSTNGFLNTVAV